MHRASADGLTNDVINAVTALIAATSITAVGLRLIVILFKYNMYERKLTTVYNTSELQSFFML